MAYVSDESGSNEVYVTTFPEPARRWQISTDGGTEPVWDPDGRTLYYRRTPSLIAATLALSQTDAAGADKPGRKPNIVFILADDLGYGDIKAFGGDKCNVDTPHFDRLCTEGMKFTDAHVTDSVCVPSRTSIMTGRYALRFGKAEQGGPWGFVGLRFPTTQHTLGELFRSGGYATGYVGKWHLGTRMTTRDGNVQGPANTDFTSAFHDTDQHDIHNADTAHK